MGVEPAPYYPNGAVNDCVIILGLVSALGPS